MFKKIFGVKSDKEIIEQVDIVELIKNDKSYYTISSDLTRKVLELAKSILDESKLHTDSIPEKKLYNVLNLYNVDKSRIIALYDTTIFKSGKDGILICDYFIGLKHAFGSAMIITFEDLVIARINEVAKNIQINDHNIDIKTNEFIKFFKRLKELFILENLYLKSKYEDYVLCALDEIESKIDNKQYDEAESIFIMLEETVIGNNKEICASLYYYGCLIRMEQLNFEQAYNYFYNLEGLQQFDNNKIIELKKMIDQRRVQNEFNLLEKQKDNFIQKNHYDKAIKIVNEQKILDIKSFEQLDKEICRIELLKKEHIKLLEGKLVEKLDSEEYKYVLNILEELNEVNPNVSYDEYYVLAKIGIYEFEEVEQRITLIKKVDTKLADKLEENLKTAKTNASEKIQTAVRCKNYSFFKENLNLRDVKDSWGMTPLMHFIIQKDLDGVKLLADTFNPNDKNVIGHTCLNLVALDYEDDFCINALRELDNDLIKMMKKYKSKSNLNKIGKVALNSLDSLNGRAFLSFEVAEMTSNCEVKMNNSLEQFESDIESYIDSLLIKNYKEFVKYSKNPKDYTSEYNKLMQEEHRIKNELKNIKKKKCQIENSILEKLEKAKNDKLDDFLFDAAEIELGGKDEFETTSEYGARKKTKVEEIKSTYLVNDYVRKQIEGLEEKVKIEISNDLNEIESEINLKFSELKSIEGDINKIHYLLNCQSKSDTNEILSYYYHTYQSKLAIDLYDADSEFFNMIVNGKKKSVKVSHKIAKEFKIQFSNLKPVYKMNLVNDGNKEKIQHNFVYDFKEEQIVVTFMEYSIE